jgi:hypothetical protein
MTSHQRVALRLPNPSAISASSKELSDTPSVFARAVSCMCIDRGSRAKTLPDADAGVKSSTLKTRVGTSCPIFAIALMGLTI